MGVDITPKQLLDQLGWPYIPRVNRLQLCCPFHQDTDPSSSFYFSTGLFFCFACELTLDIVGFYARKKEIPRGQAENELIKTYGGIPERREVDRLKVLRVRNRGEAFLKGRLTMPRKSHAALAEQLDKIIYVYEHFIISDDQFTTASGKWCQKFEGVSDGGTVIACLHTHAELIECISHRIHRLECPTCDCIIESECDCRRETTPEIPDEGVDLD